MDSLYKVDKTVGKGLGWFALIDIKAGTLICIEKPQFVPEEHPGTGETYMAAHFASFMNSFFAMSSTEQKYFLELYNAFMDPNSSNNPLIANEYMINCKFLWCFDIAIQNRIGPGWTKSFKRL